MVEVTAPLWAFIEHFLVVQNGYLWVTKKIVKHLVFSLVRCPAVMVLLLGANIHKCDYWLMVNSWSLLVASDVYGLRVIKEREEGSRSLPSSPVCCFHAFAWKGLFVLHIQSIVLIQISNQLSSYTLVISVQNEILCLSYSVFQMIGKPWKFNAYHIREKWKIHIHSLVNWPSYELRICCKFWNIECIE